MGIIAIALFPLAFSFAQEAKFLRACYNRAIATEIVDGEVEVLLAGGVGGRSRKARRLRPHALGGDQSDLGKIPTHDHEPAIAPGMAAVGKGQGWPGRAGGDGQMKYPGLDGAPVCGPFARVHHHRMSGLASCLFRARVPARVRRHLYG